jgi:uncharacterized membrane protein
MMNWYWGAGWLGMSAMVLGWVGVFAGTVWLVSYATRTEHPTHPVAPVRSDIDERFASGEISAEEYAAMRRTLTRSEGSAP